MRKLLDKIDLEIYSGIKEGSAKHFDLLFDTYYVALCNYIGSLTKDSDVAEDLVQELFANIWVNRKKNLIRSSFSSYLYRAAYNASLDYLKHQKVKEQYRIYISKQTPLSFNHSVELAELRENLIKKIDELPEQCKEIFKLSRFEHLKYKEIAEKLSISENTVDTQIRRALRRLREELKYYLITLLITFFHFF